MSQSRPMAPARRGPVWIDLDNSPHVPFFRPIVDALKRRGFEVVLTARDAYNVTDLLDLYGIRCTLVGRHTGKNKALKVSGLLWRSLRLLPTAWRHRPTLAVSHGSRAQLVAAKLAGVRTIVIADYEHVAHVAKPDVLIVPEAIPNDVAQKLSDRVLRYPGLKEDVYAWSFEPDASLLAELGLAENDIVATARPPATEAHYHRPASDVLFDAAIDHLASHPRTRIVLLPRNERQKEDLKSRYGALLASGKMQIPTKAVDGLNLVWHSDLIVSGGGTMNREAAALGVPVYSTFRGPLGAVDRYLAECGRMVLLEEPAEVPARMALVKRAPAGQRAASDRACTTIVDALAAQAA